MKNKIILIFFIYSMGFVLQSCQIEKKVTKGDRSDTTVNNSELSVKIQYFNQSTAVGLPADITSGKNEIRNNVTEAQIYAYDKNGNLTYITMVAGTKYKINSTDSVKVTEIVTYSGENFIQRITIDPPQTGLYSKNKNQIDTTVNNSELPVKIQYINQSTAVGLPADIPSGKSDIRNNVTEAQIYAYDKNGNLTYITMVAGTKYKITSTDSVKVTEIVTYSGENFIQRITIDPPQNKSKSK